MKATIYLRILIVGLLFTGCTDSFTGAEVDAQQLEYPASSSQNQAVADLSVSVEPNHSDGSVTYQDSLQDPDFQGDFGDYGMDGGYLFNFRASVQNEGPEDASGVQLAFTSNTICKIERGGDDGGDLVLVDLIGPTARSSDDSSSSSGGNHDDDDLVVVDLLGPTARSTGETFLITCLGDGEGFIEFGVEVVRADQFDPDSTPGNNNPEEDDQSRIRLYPEVPPCPDCPLTFRWDYY